MNMEEPLQQEQLLWSSKLQTVTALWKLMHHCILAQCETLKGFRQRELNPPSLNVL